MFRTRQVRADDVQGQRSLRDGHKTAMDLLREAGGREIPDARLTAADRRFVGWLLALASRHLSYEGMMHLAGGAEHAARRKREAEGGP